MKLLIILLLPFSFTLFPGNAIAQEKDIDLTGHWGRDDGLARTIEHVPGGIKMTTEDNVYFYKKIGPNHYQMEWTPSIYGGNYRWTLVVIDSSKFQNFHETTISTDISSRMYMRILA